MSRDKLIDTSNFKCDDFDQSKMKWTSYESQTNQHSLGYDVSDEFDERSKIGLFMDNCGPALKKIIALKFNDHDLKVTSFDSLFEHLRTYFQSKNPHIIRRTDDSDTPTDYITNSGDEKEENKQVAQQPKMSDFNSFEEFFNDAVIIDPYKVGSSLSNLMGLVCKNRTVIFTDSLKIRGTADDNLFNLVRKGTKVIDAIFSLSVKDRSELTFALDEVQSDWKIYSALKNLYYLVIYVIIKGRPPINNKSVPELLQGFNINFKTLYSDLTDISPDKMNWDWLRCIDLTCLPIDVKKHLEVNVAGHKLINFLKLRGEKNNYFYIGKLNAAFKFPSWDVFPLTRTSAVTTQFPFMDKCLLDLIANSYPEDYLKECAEVNLLPFQPKKNPKYQSWKQWIPENFQIKYPIIFYKN